MTIFIKIDILQLVSFVVFSRVPTIKFFFLLENYMAKFVMMHLGGKGNMNFSYIIIAPYGP